MVALLLVLLVSSVATLVAGLLQSGLGMVYASMALAVAAGVVLVIVSWRTHPADEQAAEHRPATFRAGP